MATDRYYFGSGRVYLASRHNNQPQAFTFLGNCPQLQLTPGNRGLEFAAANADDSEPFLPEFTDTIVKLTLDDWLPATLAMVLQGTSTSLPGGTGSDTLACVPGSSVPLSRINVTAFTSLMNGATSYTSGRDYTVDLPTGVVFFPASTTIPSGTALTASYTYGMVDQTNGTNSNPPEYWLRFVGVNLANGNKAVALDCYRVRLAPSNAVEFISQQDLGTFDLQATVFYDATQTGSYAIRQA